jgi:hypothetical protein
MSTTLFGFTDEEWRSAIAEANEILQESAASQPGWITYGVLASRLKSIRIEPHGGAMDHLLTQVSKEEYESGRPLLSSIVVHQDDKQPGQGFATLARWLGFVFADADEFWIKEFKRTTEYWKGRLANK